MSINISKNRRKKILIICNYYLPGFNSGGSLRTIVNMIERLGDEFDFAVVTLDHDGDKISYKNIEVNEWNQAVKAKVYYLSQDAIKLSKLRELIIKAQVDSIYINSVFSKLSITVLILRKLKLIPKINIVLAPEGELSMGALQLKAKKKRLFLKGANLAGLYDQLIWKTTSELERKEVENLTSKYEKIFIAPNMPAEILLENYKQDNKPPKNKENTRMVFLSRYMRKKNLKWFLELLPDIKQPLNLDIYGPIEDVNYWQESLEIIQHLPQNIKVSYAGSILHNEVVSTLFDYHYFVLPTLGENFGHVFIEALSAGCPIITSDRTPWLNLCEKNIGWDLPLEKPHKWLEVINECLNADQMKYDQMSSKARSFAVEWLLDKEVKAATEEVLNYSINNTLLNQS